MDTKIKFTWQSKVRDYELDSLGIVNNATFINYLEQCRNDYARSMGIDFIEYYRSGYTFVVASINIQYRASLKDKDEFYVTAELASFNERRICFEQQIRHKNNHGLVAKAEVLIACVDNKTGRSCMPEMLKNSLPVDKYIPLEKK